MNKRQRLEEVITDLESQRQILGNDVVDTAIAPLGEVLYIPDLWSYISVPN